MVGTGFTSRNEALGMIDTSVEIVNKLGLHARASEKLIGVTSKYTASIQIGKANALVDAKNIISLLMLGAGKGTTLRLLIDGADEQDACDEILALFAARFNEAE
ncbi:MAG: HPr family phosphocarrier protein [Acinetobacter sp.]|nr:MAG: HPr family phosphocarrier protein [Acinetobacter sp.]